MHRGHYRFTVFHTPCELQLFAPAKADTDRAAHAILKQAKRLEKRYNFFDPDSYLNRVINRRSEETVVLDAESAGIFAKVREYSEQVGHRFDITLGTVKGCYDLSTLEAIHRCREEKAPFCGPERWRIGKKRLSVDNPHTLFDLGGVIKEYAVDEAAKILKRNRIVAGVVNFGGDLYVHGRHPEGRAFEVGIKDPQNPSRHIMTVELENSALTTSAHYERNRVVEGTVISHIVARDESRSTLQSATVIAPSALFCGIVTTAMMADETLLLPGIRTIRVAKEGVIEAGE